MLVSQWGDVSRCGRRYYIEMVHKVTASGVGGSFLLGAHMYNTVYTHAQSDMARNERQLIKSTSTPQAEIQVTLPLSRRDIFHRSCVFC